MPLLFQLSLDLLDAEIGLQSNQEHGCIAALSCYLEEPPIEWRWRVGRFLSPFLKNRGLWRPPSLATFLRRCSLAFRSLSLSLCSLLSLGLSAQIADHKTAYCAWLLLHPNGVTGPV